MNNLEKIISNNKEQFNDSEPIDGHFSRFESKLDSFNKKKKTRPFTYFLRIAAVAVLLILSTLYVYDKITMESSNADSQKMLTLSDLSDEYQEVEFYYTSLLNERYSEIDKLYANNDEEKKLVLDEISEMDILYKKMLEDLSTNPNDERVINSLIQHYKLKVSVLNRIINKLNNLKSQKQTDHEKIEI